MSHTLLLFIPWILIVLLLQDLEEEEARAAIEQHAEHQRSGTLPPARSAYDEYKNFFEKKKAQLQPSSLGAHGVRQDLLDLEDALQSGSRLRSPRSCRRGHG